ncbi:MAG: hypothetical protein Q4F83_11895 [Eubacteriales bacterium]|nr:hypothetical protein [Eubacteriales bacterium]
MEKKYGFPIETIGMAFSAGYGYDEDWFDHTMDTIWNNYRYLKEELNKRLPQVTVYVPKGTCQVFLDLRELVPEDQVQEFVQIKCHLPVDCGGWSGENDKGSVRINLATGPAYIKNAVETLIFEAKRL